MSDSQLPVSGDDASGLMQDLAQFLKSEQSKPFRKALHGFRTWHVVLTTEGKPRLVGTVFTGQIWLPRKEFEAHCLALGGPEKNHNGDPEVPGDECECGVYARKDKITKITGPLAKATRGGLSGEVWLRGKIVPDEDGGGWAATFGYPLSIHGFFCSSCEEMHDLERLAVCEFLPQYKTKHIQGGVMFRCSSTVETPTLPAFQRLRSSPCPLRPSDILRSLAEEYGLAIVESLPEE